MAKNPRLVDISGKTFGRWSVLQKTGNHPRGGALWLCRCECGNEQSVLAWSLRSGKSKSCGCLRRQVAANRSMTHGWSNSCAKSVAQTRLYECWKNMRRRCNDAANHRYGGRGITVCDEWMDFHTFRAWALSSGYSEELTIERIDIDRGYEPSNCTWADAAQQSKNRGFIKVDETGEPWFEKARRNGIPVKTFHVRVSAGWSREEAATWPLGKRRVQRKRNERGQFA